MNNPELIIANFILPFIPGQIWEYTSDEVDSFERPVLKKYKEKVIDIEHEEVSNEIPTEIDVNSFKQNE